MRPQTCAALDSYLLEQRNATCGPHEEEDSEMTPDSVRRALLAGSCITAPLFGLVAAVATPGLATTAAGRINAIAASPDRFYVYALSILLSSMLLVPAVFALTELVRPQRPWAALIAGAVSQIGMLVAVGDAASELVFWQMGAHGRDLSAMAAVTDSFDSAPGSSLVYTVGGLCTLAGVLVLGFLLWRTSTLPTWAAACLPVGGIVNIVGFSIGSQPLLVSSYVVLAAALVPAARAITTPRAVPRPAPEESRVVAPVTTDR